MNNKAPPKSQTVLSDGSRYGPLKDTAQDGSQKGESQTSLIMRETGTTREWLEDKGKAMIAGERKTVNLKVESPAPAGLYRAVVGSVLMRQTRGDKAMKTHIIKDGGSLTYCGRRHGDPAGSIYPGVWAQNPRWLNNHPYPASLQGRLCNQCIRLAVTAGVIDKVREEK